MTDKPRYNQHAVRADILRGLDLTAYAAEGNTLFQRNHGGIGAAALAAHYEQLGKVVRRLHALAGRGLLDHLSAAADDEDDSYETPYEAQYAWHTIRFYRGPAVLEPGDVDLIEEIHPAQCSALPPGAACWFTHDPRRDWWPTSDEHRTYRLRPGFHLVGGGQYGDDPDVHEYFDTQVLDETTKTWTDWHGRTVGEAKADAKAASTTNPLPHIPVAENDPLLLRRRPIPDQINYVIGQLTSQLTETIPRQTFTIIAATVTTLGVISDELRNTNGGGQ